MSWEIGDKALVKVKRNGKISKKECEITGLDKTTEYSVVKLVETGETAKILTSALEKIDEKKIIDFDEAVERMKTIYPELFDEKGRYVGRK